MKENKKIDISELGANYSEKHKELEENAIDKFEKGAKTYRPTKKYKAFAKPIQCSKCGSVIGTMLEMDGLYFCQNCVKQKMMELRNKKR